MNILGTVLLLALPQAGIHKTAKPDHGQTRWELELAFGAIAAVEDDYTDTLDDFGFGRDPYASRARLHFNVTLNKALSRYVLVGAHFRNFAREMDYERRDQFPNGDASTTEFTIRPYGIGAHLRLRWPVGKRGIFQPFIQAGAGMGVAQTRFTRGVRSTGGIGTNSVDQDIHYNYYASLDGGLALMWSKHFGMFTQWGYAYAPIVENNFGQRHNSGGPSWVLGFRGAI